MTKAPVILLVGDAVVPTGYSRVIRSAFGPLATKFHFEQLATRFGGGTHDYPWPLHAVQEGNSPYGYDDLPRLLGQVRPAAVVLLYDLVYQQRFVSIVHHHAPQTKIVVYSPIEGAPVEPHLLAEFNQVDKYVVFTEYASRLVSDAFANLARERAEWKPPDIEVIPHGVDTTVFRPLLPDVERSRSLARQQLGLTDASFIVLNANRNIAKKRLDLTVRGFARFAKDKPPSVQLYLHAEATRGAWNLIALARRHEVLDRLILTRDEGTVGVDSEMLNLIYNACDVGINSSTNEGWGLVSFEHAATNRAQILPRHGCLPELWQDAAEWIDPALVLTNPGEMSDCYLVSESGVASALERIFRTPDRLARLSNDALAVVEQERYQWSAISSQWENLLDSVIEFS